MDAPGPGAWIIMPLPVHRPTWLKSSWKKTRSPGCMAYSATAVPVLAWPTEVRGSETPATFQAAWVRPELWYEPGPAAPQTQGLPIWERAKASTWMTLESYPGSTVGRPALGPAAG